MRTAAGVLVALLVVLAGCGAAFQDTNETPTGSVGPGEGTTTTDGGATSGPAPEDPPEDRLGWESGFWYNESVAVNASDGLNESERSVVVARSMARVEVIRGLEFKKAVNVTIISREEFRQQQRQRRNYTSEFRLFDNAKFEALFLVGEDKDALTVQNQNLGENILGLYSPRNETIFIISESETPMVRDELTLGHELVHALQDQHYGLDNYRAGTRDGHNGHNGLIEGDANYVQQHYRKRCESGTLTCITPGNRSGQGGGDFHIGVYIFSYFPYSDGPGFVNYYHNRGGWERVNALYEDPPASAEQIINPEKYPDEAPTDVALKDTNRGGWERLRPEAPREDQRRADYGTLGQAAMTSMFAYTIYDEYNKSKVVQPRAFLNLDGEQVNRTDPFNYALPPVDGWEGDRLHVYSHPDQGNETAYVWKSVWDSPADAREFADAYRALLAHWGGERVSENLWRVEESPFKDSFYVEVQGDTVVIVNAPSEEALGEISEEAR